MIHKLLSLSLLTVLTLGCAQQASAMEGKTSVWRRATNASVAAIAASYSLKGCSKACDLVDKQYIEGYDQSMPIFWTLTASAALATSAGILAAKAYQGKKFEDPTAYILPVAQVSFGSTITAGLLRSLTTSSNATFSDKCLTASGALLSSLLATRGGYNIYKNLQKSK